MTAAGLARPLGAMVARTASLLCALLMLLSVHATVAGSAPALADGPQTPDPTLTPTTITSQTDPFTIEPPIDAICAEDGSGTGVDPDPGPRTGADNWRWHSYIVEAGRDPSTLRFGAFGAGDDYDASDGSITAGLIDSTGMGVWSRPPALKPEGRINPNDLAGLVLDPATYTLVDGDYDVGFACTDDRAEVRRWWSVTITVDTSGPAFLRGPGASTPPPETGPPAEPEPEADAPTATPSTTPDGGPPGLATVAAPRDVTNATPGSGGDLAAAPTVDASRALTGVSWAPLAAVVGAPGLLPIGGWGVLALALFRIGYLLATPVRVLPPPAP